MKSKQNIHSIAMLLTSALTFALSAAVFLTSTSSRAEGGVSTTTGPSLSGSIADQYYAIRPQVGFMNYTDSTQTSYTELALGATFDMNALRAYNPFGIDPSLVLIGPETGLIYSHLSNSGSSFFYLPLNIKAGYMVMDNMRIGLHGGWNLTYRTTANAMRLTDGPQGQGAALTFLPNFGADIDYSFKSFTLAARPDVTFTSGNDIISATLELVIPFNA